MTRRRGLNRLIALVATGVVLACSSAADALPDNTRQVPEGYWVGGQPEAHDIASLHEHGIRVILSAVVLDQETRTACRRLGIERVNVWFGNNFPNAHEILDGLADYTPAQIYIHCTHGGDRAGALLAFLLVAQQQWRPDHALLAVAFPGDRDVDNLVDLLEEAGMTVTEFERVAYTGLYSGVENGGTGGLKVRGPDYRNLVRTMLDACRDIGVVVEDTSEPPLTVASEAPGGSVAQPQPQ